MKRIVFTLIFTLFSLVGFAQQAYEVQHFAHRGSRHEFDENTLSAFQGTYDKGIRGYETDIRMTKDGELIINHDASLKRTAGVDLGVLRIIKNKMKFYNTQFADRDTSSGRYRMGNDYSDADYINFDAINDDNLMEGDINYEKRFAEVLVDSYIPLDMIENIDNPIKFK